MEGTLTFTVTVPKSDIADFRLATTGQDLAGVEDAASALSEAITIGITEMIGESNGVKVTPR